MITGGTVAGSKSVWKKGPYVLAKLSSGGDYEAIGSVNVLGLDRAVEEMLAHCRDERAEQISEIVVSGRDAASGEWFRAWNSGETRTLIFRDVRRALWIHVTGASVKDKTVANEFTLSIAEARVETDGPQTG